MYNYMSNISYLLKEPDREHIKQHYTAYTS